MLGTHSTLLGKYLIISAMIPNLSITKPLVFVSLFSTRQGLVTRKKFGCLYSGALLYGQNIKQCLVHERAHGDCSCNTDTSRRPFKSVKPNTFVLQTDAAFSKFNCYIRRVRGVFTATSHERQLIVMMTTTPVNFAALI